jgi:hypothetical protein
MRKKIQSHKKGHGVEGYNTHSIALRYCQSRAKHGISSEVSVRGGGDIRLRSLHVNAGFRGVEAYRITLYTSRC